MTKRADFNAEDWATVLSGPLYAGMRVISADRGGTWRETVAMGRVYQQAREQHEESELLDDLVKSAPSIDPDRLREAGGNIGPLTSEQLREATRLVEEKATPAEVEAYKRFIWTIAQAVATAHKEGGFLGVGGQPISEAEQQALDEISSALGDPPAGGRPGDPPPS
jgi:hypothetical protein